MSEEGAEKDLEETLYLLSLPGMRESIREGLQTPSEECSEEPGWSQLAEPEEEAWLAAMARNSAFGDLASPEEDIYSLEDGEPFRGSSTCMPQRTFSAILHREKGLYVARCPEVRTVSQGPSIEEALANLQEATELYLEEFPPSEGEKPQPLLST
jgi:predicted RNase H-like HicB family nuclease